MARPKKTETPENLAPEKVAQVELPELEAFAFSIVKVENEYKVVKVKFELNSKKAEVVEVAAAGRNKVKAIDQMKVLFGRYMMRNL